MKRITMFALAGVLASAAALADESKMAAPKPATPAANATQTAAPAPSGGEAPVKAKKHHKKHHKPAKADGAMGMGKADDKKADAKPMTEAKPTAKADEMKPVAPAADMKK